MANSRIMLVCKHCGGEFCIGKGYFGEYFTRNDNLHNELNAFYDAHGQGICSDVADCSDNARDHFVILEEGETLADVAPRSEVIDDHHKQATCYTIGCLEGDKIKREVAREIFEKIEELAIYGTTPLGLCLMSIGVASFAELKKKYTEGTE